MATRSQKRSSRVGLPRTFRLNALRNDVLNEISIMGEILFEGVDIAGKG